MIRTLIKHGSGYALVFDQEILDLLHIRPDTPMEVTTDGTVLTIRPLAEHGRQDRIATSLDEVNLRHGDALRKLSE